MEVAEISVTVSADLVSQLPPWDGAKPDPGATSVLGRSFKHALTLTGDNEDTQSLCENTWVAPSLLESTEHLGRNIRWVSDETSLRRSCIRHGLPRSATIQTAWKGHDLDQTIIPFPRFDAGFQNDMIKTSMTLTIRSRVPASCYDIREPITIPQPPAIPPVFQSHLQRVYLEIRLSSAECMPIDHLQGENLDIKNWLPAIKLRSLRVTVIVPFSGTEDLAKHSCSDRLKLIWGLGSSIKLARKTLVWSMRRLHIEQKTFVVKQVFDGTTYCEEAERAETLSFTSRSRGLVNASSSLAYNSHARAVLGS
ncbi:hypothetical protein M409DRAFT_53217 [Zasmidium cellare ATCC 36951]|uniref:Uncharacterized protein n=1 Tax=Zasmidium cellare ATCC 36951 TaxID=1080233 RepID=A0A6A6CS19_ZASCE|nr:uncharacterized protein M409DRAFT_53217 [Zasmidium cellare ATCC 36951]KAF2168559.1 hypothetical protein M409DRAFT_53217 [Zasmidium cellare ATCC 36951]